MKSQQILEKLIGFATVSRDSNLALIEFIRDYLTECGVECELIHNDERSKANLWATIGPTDRGGVVLSGHTDVVPVDGQPWTLPPFEMTERDGKLYGRGTADMKGYIACVLAAVPSFVSADLKTPIHLAFSYDEEVGCLGVRSILSMLEDKPHQPTACIIGEPTELKPVLGHKGKLGVRCHVKGAPCHSAYAPEGVNAIENAAKLITKLTQIGERLAESSRRDERFYPPFSTVQTGVIEGGQALNIVPADCRFNWEVRSLPGFDAGEVEREMRDYAESELIPKMRAVVPDTDIVFEPLQSYPGLTTEASSEVAALIATLAGRNDFGTVAYGTEGGLFHEAGIPTVVCGPGCMDQGHKPDEFIAIEQLERCDAMMQRLVEHLGA
ncbi:acetylornithine deacetylase [Salinicola rhizosphaerae]|uniref:Acetylornithine deacetylase n=1 Tax=Salinicola rhizosphaerae TaxID=1443141 RepID=A0ABQ3DUX2_9GAMM|nr:acetylornithine deacetylase [Salinicola rhizosphaerae]GHB13892.1 acetylornithine deacetylase [Salinicola rhizosphaerae]